MKKKRRLRKEVKFVLTLCAFFSCSMFILNTNSKLLSKTETDSKVQVAKPVVEIVSDIAESDVVDGEKVVKYFSVSNYKENEITDVALYYYLYFVNEENEIINNLTLYHQIDDNNPNEFEIVNKVENGKYKDYFEGVEFDTKKKKHEYKLIIEEPIDYKKVYVKVIAVQKDVSL